MSNLAQLEESYCRGFIKAAAGFSLPKLPENLFSVKAQPSHVSLGYSYTPNSGAPKSVTTSYAGAKSINAPPSGISVEYPTYKSEIKATPAQLKSPYESTGRTNEPAYHALSGWDKYQTYLDAPWYKKLTGVTPRPILSHSELQATQPFANDISGGDLASKLLTTPEGRSELYSGASQPYTAATGAELGGWAGKRMGAQMLGQAATKVAPPLYIAGLLSGLVNEARTTPHNIVNAGGVGNYLNNESSINANFSSTPGYLKHVLDNYAKPVTTLGTVANDVPSLVKEVLPILSRRPQSVDTALAGF